MPTFALLVLFLLLPFQDAHAYLDPGTGTALVQLIIAGAAGIIYACSAHLKTMLAFLRRGAPKQGRRASTPEKES